MTETKLDGTGDGGLLAYVGAYSSPAHPDAGGISILRVARDGSSVTTVDRTFEPKLAGYLAYAATTGCLYAVDERKTDGRGPVDPPAAVHAFRVDPSTGALTWLNAQPAPGPRPTFLDLHEPSGSLLTANHGDFQHVERVVKGADGRWTSEFVYDDSTVLLYGLEANGEVGPLRDAKVLRGHGMDPNRSAQNGGHAQASSHAHCAVVDPSGRYVLVGDKGTDQILVYALGPTLTLAYMHQCVPETGPRHIAFDTRSGHAYVTFEFASDLASFAFDPKTGRLDPLDQVSTTTEDYAGRNEPAEVRVHPDGGLVYVNNRGQDSVAWFKAGDNGKLQRGGHVATAKSIHPGLAARSFTFDPTGAFMLFADRPANVVRSYGVDRQTGALSELTQIEVLEPAYVAFVDLKAGAEQKERPL